MNVPTKGSSMKKIEDMSAEECLQLMATQLHEQYQLLRSIRMNLIVIAIPFWFALCGVLAAIALFVLTLTAS